MTYLGLLSVCIVTLSLVACDQPADRQAIEGASSSSQAVDENRVTTTFTADSREVTVAFDSQGEWTYSKPLREWMEMPFVRGDEGNPFADILSGMTWQPQTHVFYHGPGGFGYMEYWESRTEFMNAKNSDVPADESNPPTGEVVTDDVVMINGTLFRKVHTYYNHDSTESGYVLGRSGTTHTHCAYFPEGTDSVLYVGAIDALDHDTCQMLIELNASVTVE